MTIPLFEVIGNSIRHLPTPRADATPMKWCLIGAACTWLQSPHTRNSEETLCAGAAVPNDIKTSATRTFFMAYSLWLAPPDVQPGWPHCNPRPNSIIRGVETLVAGQGAGARAHGSALRGEMESEGAALEGLLLGARRVE